MQKLQLLFLSLFISLQLTANEEGQKLIDTEKAQKFQIDYDDQFFLVNRDFEKIRHILLHLVKTVGKMATYCESVEHGKETDPSKLIDEVTPDLLIHALQLSNFYQLDLGTKYEERIGKNVQKLTAQK